MPSLIDRSSGRRYWRSLDELSNTPEFRSFVESEFPNLSSLLDKSPTRRQFLKVMGASLGLAGLTGCRWPVETIVPFAKQPTGRAPGISVRYATTMELAGVGTGLLVTSYDGRPIKVEGNEKHPLSLGSTDALMQAAILEMYDPDRSTQPRQRGQKDGKPWAEFDAFASAHFAKLKQAGGEGLFVLAEPSSSVTLAAVKARWSAAFPKAQWLEYDALSRDNERSGLTRVLGKPHRPQYNLAAADVIVSLDSDFLLQHPAALKLTRDYASRRGAHDGTMNRLYVMESNLSLTGSNADYRFAVRSSDIGLHLAQLASALLKKGVKLPAGADALAGELTASEAGAPKFIEQVAADSQTAGGKAVILVGPRQPAEAHALAAVLNAALGSKAVSYTEDGEARPTHLEAIRTLADKLGTGEVKTLVVLGANPAFTAPADLDLAAKLEKVPVSIHLGLYADETGSRCSWHAPQAHFLETWGDARAWDGTLSLSQPLIEPLYAGRTTAQLLAGLLGEKASAYDLTRAAFKNFAGGGDFETAWRTVLHDGIVPGTAAPLKTPPVSASGLAGIGAALAKPAGIAKDGFEVVFAQDNKIYDGRFGNNGWLQELPDPLTKLTWDNAALISPADAKRLGLRRDDRIDITIGNRSLKIPVCVLPGHAVGSLTLPLGYGREQGGVVARGSGFDTYKIRTTGGWHFAAAGVKSSGSSYRLATTQDHHVMDTKVGNDELERRVGELVREGTLDEYKADPKFAHKRVHELPLAQLFGEFKSEKHRWAMTIDLAKCTGCSACVVACQSENNIPVVGKEEVELGREMHWIRIDRYFRGDPEHADSLSVVHQPVNCMQCENAPCEQVCPVGATMHDEDGLNAMVYNRCIGTRYCSNNCPYKVRRYNWFYNQHGPKHPRSLANGTIEPLSYQNPGLLPKVHVTEIEMLSKNPRVTVRARGVMEKCTYCVQRISEAKIKYRNESVTPTLGNDGATYHIPDGEVVPACAQACPAEAIVFGDLNDKGSRVARSQADDRCYAMLGEFNFRPRTQYMAKLRNVAGGNAGHEHGPEDKPAEHKPAAGHA